MTVFELVNQLTRQLVSEINNLANSLESDQPQAEESRMKILNFELRVR